MARAPKSGKTANSQGNSLKKHSAEHLRPYWWQPGQSGKNWTAPISRKWFTRVYSARLIRATLCFKEILDRCEGRLKPVDDQELAENAIPTYIYVDMPRPAMPQLPERNGDLRRD